MAIDTNAPKITTTFTLNKFDHSGDTPRLVETIVSKDGIIISKEMYAKDEDKPDAT